MDDAFAANLLFGGSKALGECNLTAAEKVAIVSGDIWLGKEPNRSANPGAGDLASTAFNRRDMAGVIARAKNLAVSSYYAMFRAL